jgi:hypothetical protein
LRISGTKEFRAGYYIVNDPVRHGRFAAVKVMGLPKAKQRKYFDALFAVAFSPNSTPKV